MICGGTVNYNYTTSPQILSLNHRRQPRRGCRGRIPTNILVGGDINGNVPTNIRGGNVVEYELLIASVKRKQR